MHADKSGLLIILVNYENDKPNSQGFDYEDMCLLPPLSLSLSPLAGSCREITKSSKIKWHENVSIARGGVYVSTKLLSLCGVCTYVCRRHFV